LSPAAGSIENSKISKQLAGRFRPVLLKVRFCPAFYAFRSLGPKAAVIEF
jgi:hypothetical protein